MRAQTDCAPQPLTLPQPALYRLAPGRDGDGEGARQLRPAPKGVNHEDLPYKVEVWNEAGTSVEQILAVTANASIGYAAYYAATREFSDRTVTLRHKNSIISRWNAGGH